MHRFKNIFLFCVYKTIDISAETFVKSCIQTMTQVRKSKNFFLWIIIKYIGEKLNVKNIFGLVDKKNNLKLIILQKNILESIKDMDHN